MDAGLCGAVIDDSSGAPRVQDTWLELRDGEYVFLACDPGSSWRWKSWLELRDGEYVFLDGAVQASCGTLSAS